MASRYRPPTKTQPQQGTTTTSASAVSSTKADDPVARDRSRLAASGIVSKFVQDHKGDWNHADWLGFLNHVRGAGYRSLADDEIGRLLEEQKTVYWKSNR